MSDEIQEHKTLLFKIPDGRTLTGTATLEMPTLRDQFAMAALSAIIQLTSVLTIVEAAETSYRMADAMLEVRKKNP